VLSCQAKSIPANFISIPIKFGLRYIAFGGCGRALSTSRKVGLEVPYEKARTYAEL